MTTDRRKQRYADTKNATRTGSGTRKLIAVFGQKRWYADRKNGTPIGTVVSGQKQWYWGRYTGTPIGTMVPGQEQWYSGRYTGTPIGTVVLGHKQRYSERNILQRQPLYDISYADCPRTQPGPPRSETGHPLNRISYGHVCFPRVSLTTHTLHRTNISGDSYRRSDL